MKIISGSERCKMCGRSFLWKYLDDGYRAGSAPYTVAFEPLVSDGTFAVCDRRIEIPQKVEYLMMHCPHCQTEIAMPCNEHILQQLYKSHRI